VTLTRSKVAESLRELVAHTEAKELAAPYRDGGQIDEAAIEKTYRDVKRCVACNRRSEKMLFGMVPISEPLAGLIGPREEHMRLCLYGICRFHIRIAENDPSAWEARLNRRLQEGLQRRIRETAQGN
jgi:hypothetical protein